MAENTIADPTEATEGTALDPVVYDVLGIEMRTAGFCYECRRLVERMPDGSCPAGHHPGSIAGRMTLLDDRELPQLPVFNWGAFFMPMIWGPANGLWAGMILFPVWLFADSIFMSAYRNGGGLYVAAFAVGVLTLWFMAWFARTASISAYMRVSDRMTIAAFNNRQKKWAVGGAVFFIGVMALATYYNIFLYEAVKAAAV